MIELYAALAVLDALVLWVLVLLDGAWLPRAAAVGAALAANLWLLGASPDVSGLSTSAEPPDGAQIAGCLVDEPRYVYLWLARSGEPRAYRRPYSRALHATCAQARRAAARGVRVGIRRDRAAQGDGPGTALYVLPPPGGLKPEPTVDVSDSGSRSRSRAPGTHRASSRRTHGRGAGADALAAPTACCRSSLRSRRRARLPVREEPLSRAP